MSNIQINPYIVAPVVPFDPLSISDMKGWWDSSDITTITKDGSNFVSVWGDKSGNSYDMITNGGDPLWVSSGKNGLDVIDFAGSKSLKVTAEILTQPTTYCVACLVPVDDVNTRVIFRFGVGLFTKYVKTNVGTGQLALESGGGLNVVTSPSVANTWQSQILVVNGASSEIIVDDVSLISGNAGADSPSDVWYLQVNATNNNQYGDSQIGEMIVYEKLLTATEISDVNTYFVNKWGL